MWPPFCLTTSCKRTLAFVTTFRHKSSESARHSFTMWALSCPTFSDLLWRLSEDLCRKVVTNARVRLQEVVRQNGGHIERVLHLEQFSSLWGLILYQMSNVFVIIKMCYVHNQWYYISCATLYISYCAVGKIFLGNKYESINVVYGCNPSLFSDLHQTHKVILGK